MRRILKVGIVALGALLCLGLGFALYLAYGPLKVSPPPRPANVPATALWKGGPDGGHWIDCTRSKDLGLAYDCVVYNEHEPDAGVIATGTYVLCRVLYEGVDGNVYERMSLTGRDSDVDELVRSSMLGASQSNEYDIIHLSSGLALVPDGFVDYPDDGEHGSKQEYKEGIPVGGKIEY